MVAGTAELAEGHHPHVRDTGDLLNVSMGQRDRADHRKEQVVLAGYGLYCTMVLRVECSTAWMIPGWQIESAILLYTVDFPRFCTFFASWFSLFAWDRFLFVLHVAQRPFFP